MPARVSDCYRCLIGRGAVFRAAFYPGVCRGQVSDVCVCVGWRVFGCLWCVCVCGWGLLCLAGRRRSGTGAGTVAAASMARRFVLNRCTDVNDLNKSLLFILHRYTSAAWRTPIVACDVTIVNLFLFRKHHYAYCLEIRVQYL